MEHATHKSCVARLRRIEGQVRGVARMIEDERYCIDILTQLLAVRAALKKVEEEILKDHVEHCVENAIAGGDPAEQRRKVRKVAELLQVFEKRTS
jgi:DNA-binding FrmR family transcriptional regulator